MKQPILYIVIPCCNEEKVLPVTAPIFLKYLNELCEKGKISKDSRLLFVDDGSSDTTWELVCSFSKGSEYIEGISLSRNRGHQNALIAGMAEVVGRCDAVVTMDCDGQDDPSLIEKMCDEYLGGCDIVYGVRNSRKTDSFFKRASARIFYGFLRSMGVETVYDHADFRLMSSRAVKALLEFPEVNLYLRGTVPMVGFKSTAVEYERLERKAGKSHYSIAKMAALAVNAVTGFSVKPLRMISFLGFTISLVSFIGIIWTLWQYFFGTTVAGWSSTLCVLCFLSGVQLLSVGVVGEYIGKIYMETKRRPRFIVSERTEDIDTKQLDRK